MVLALDYGVVVNLKVIKGLGVNYLNLRYQIAWKTKELAIRVS